MTRRAYGSSLPPRPQPLTEENPVERIERIHLSAMLLAETGNLVKALTRFKEELKAYQELSESEAQVQDICRAKFEGLWSRLQPVIPKGVSFDACRTRADLLKDGYETITVHQIDLLLKDLSRH